MLPILLSLAISVNISEVPTPWLCEHISHDLMNAWVNTKHRIIVANNQLFITDYGNLVLTRGDFARKTRDICFVYGGYPLVGDIIYLTNSATLERICTYLKLAPTIPKINPIVDGIILCSS